MKKLSSMLSLAGTGRVLSGARLSGTGPSGNGLNDAWPSDAWPGGTRLDTSSPAAYRASITRMADAAGRGNYGKTRAALFSALHDLQSRFVAEYLADKQRSWGRQVEAQARFDALMQGKTSQEILALSRNDGILH